MQRQCEEEPQNNYLQIKKILEEKTKNTLCSNSQNFATSKTITPATNTTTSHHYNASNNYNTTTNNDAENINQNNTLDIRSFTNHNTPNTTISSALLNRSSTHISININQHIHKQQINISLVTATHSR